MHCRFSWSSVMLRYFALHALSAADMLPDDDTGREGDEDVAGRP